ncbi:MAG: alpha/beta fold hydrolase, partial [Pyrinomonadaceae bacterium]
MKRKVFALIFLLSAVAVAAQENNLNTIELKLCDVPGPGENSKMQARCGTLLVPEDRKVKSGRQIPLKIVVFPATGKQRENDPVFFLSGGPGSAAASEDGPYVAQELKKVNESRDLVFVDQRGTGGSNGLECELFDKNDLQSFLGHWNPPARLRECRQRLEKTADLKLYTTTIAMDDLDAVRKALGYKKINLMGGSYGTRAAQEYIRRYGKNVRAAVLHGVSLASQFMPRDFPQDTQRALDGVVQECLADAA